MLLMSTPSWNISQSGDISLRRRTSSTVLSTV